MSGLVAYASSDDGSDVDEQNPPQQQQQPVSQPSIASKNDLSIENSSKTIAAQTSQNSTQPLPQETAAPLNDTPLGPSMGPSLPPMDEPEETEASAAAPSSPYSTNRALIQDLTLPSVPDFDIPPSPPGSPSPVTNKKFQQFIDLKKKGTHFNAKLESSTATRNPALMDKLLGFVDVTDTNQYQTTLPTGLWDPSAFPDWAYRSRLRRATDKVAKEREAERSSGSRNTVEFVGAVGSGTSGSSSARGQKRRAE